MDVREHITEIRAKLQREGRGRYSERPESRVHQGFHPSPEIEGMMTQGRTACRWHIRAGENETKEIPAFFRRHSITDGLARILMRRGLDTEDKLSHFLYDDL